MARQPHLLIEPDDVHDLALLPGDPGRVERIARRCDDSSTVSTNREYAVVNAVVDGRPVTICSTGIGAPSAAIAVEELLRCGVDTFIRVGTCGALQPGLALGEHIIATAAAKDEGTTRRYEAATIPAVAAHSVTAALQRESEASDHPARIGPIVTDDAFYAETEEYITDWSAAGLLAIEMEAAAIFTLARRHDAKAGAICTVDGNLVEGTQKGESDREQELPEASDAAIDAAIDVALEASTTL